MEGRCCLNIGLVKENMGDLNEAITYTNKAIQISKNHDIYELLHMCYTSMSLLYHTKRNDYRKALRYCHLSSEVTKHLPQRVIKMSETLILKSDILIKAGDFASARQTLVKAYRLNTNSIENEDRTNIIKSLKIGKSYTHTHTLFVVAINIPNYCFFICSVFFLFSSSYKNLSNTR